MTCIWAVSIVVTWVAMLVTVLVLSRLVDIVLPPVRGLLWKTGCIVAGAYVFFFALIETSIWLALIVWLVLFVWLSARLLRLDRAQVAIVAAASLCLTVSVHMGLVAWLASRCQSDAAP